MRKLRRRRRSLGSELPIPSVQDLPQATEAELYELSRKRAHELVTDPDTPGHIITALAKLISQCQDNGSDVAASSAQDLKAYLASIRGEEPEAEPPSEPSEDPTFDLVKRRVKWMLEYENTPPHMTLALLKVVLPWKSSGKLQ